jgi:hypothetical protein
MQAEYWMWTPSNLSGLDVPSTVTVMDCTPRMERSAYYLPVSLSFKTSTVLEIRHRQILIVLGRRMD